MNADEILRYLTGEESLPEPTTKDPAAWRAYLLGRQRDTLRASQEVVRPSSTFSAALAAVRAEFLARFPGEDEAAEIIFSPSDPPPPAITSGPGGSLR